MTHTPGPWIAQPSAGFETHAQSLIYAENGGETVALCYNGTPNARLIAAAPDLLEALKVLLDDWETAFDLDYCEGDPDAMRVKDMALAAITKATEAAA